MPSAWTTRGVVLVVFLTVGCSSSPPAAPVPTTMRAVDVGTAIDADGAISKPTRTFGPQDVVYLSIATEGSTPGSLTVQWYANTKLVATETLPIHPTGPANFAFHQLPSAGWPRGKSKAIFFMAPEEKHAVEFEVP